MGTAKTFLKDAEWNSLYNLFVANAAWLASKPKEKRQETERLCREALANEPEDVKDLLNMLFAIVEKHAADRPSA